LTTGCSGRREPPSRLPRVRRLGNTESLVPSVVGGGRRPQKPVEGCSEACGLQQPQTAGDPRAAKPRLLLPHPIWTELLGRRTKPAPFASSPSAPSSPPPYTPPYWAIACFVRDGRRGNLGQCVIVRAPPASDTAFYRFSAGKSSQGSPAAPPSAQTAGVTVQGANTDNGGDTPCTACVACTNSAPCIRHSESIQARSLLSFCRSDERRTGDSAGLGAYLGDQASVRSPDG
jgi:hypothetical protein